MLKPQQGEFVPYESPVFGKPWYWERSSSTMESSRSLAHVIMEMREEIQKLETENRALRGGLGQQPSGTEPEEASPGAPVAEDNPPCLRRNVSAPALEGQYKENIVMTVRRYSFASNAHSGPLSGVRPDRAPGAGGRNGGPHGASSWGRLQQEVHKHASNMFGSSSLNEISASAKERISNRRSLQEYVHQNRAKVKTVTFLLPVDDIYTNRPVLASHQAGPNPYELDAIAETDS